MEIESTKIRIAIINSKIGRNMYSVGRTITVDKLMDA
jgi:hypothetical protein